VNETLFKIELRERYYNRSNAICGFSEGITEETDEVNKEMDLILLIVIYQSETVFVDSSFGYSSAPKGCGNESFPCSSFKIGLSDLAIVYERKIYVKNVMAVEECVKMKDISMKTRNPPVSVDISSSVERMSGNDGELNGMFFCVDCVEFSKLNFVFPLSSCSPYPPTVFETHSSFNLSSCSFSSSPSDSPPSLLPYSLFLIEDGTTEIAEVTMEGMRWKERIVMIRETKM
jgi:hypothetical protein